MGIGQRLMLFHGTPLKYLFFSTSPLHPCSSMFLNEHQKLGRKNSSKSLSTPPSYPHDGLQSSRWESGLWKKCPELRLERFLELPEAQNEEGFFCWGAHSKRKTTKKNKFLVKVCGWLLSCHNLSATFQNKFFLSICKKASVPHRESLVGGS